MSEHDDQARPDPDELLARVQQLGTGVERGAGSDSPARGRLKVFFGMAPGVGKTFAMLAAAQRMAATGVDVVAGIVETHGRSETEQLLLGLDLIPRRRIEYRGPDGTAAPVMLEEFDVAAAIVRHPDILLVDELAHTNAPGSAATKRWQDVQACLNAGINVYTTLNVQHIESLNDVVAQITAVRVRETIPDWVIDEADEIELVDTPPEILHERLRSGRVYQGESASRAVDPSDGFFRTGNLAALRELALRRTAAWVDSQMRRYKADRGIRAVWPAGDRILVAVSPSPMSPMLVRAAKRMAAALHADLLAVYVETPRTTRLAPADRERLLQTLRLAESLGASTATLSASNGARELIAFARARNVSRIVVGKTGQSRFREAIFGNFVNNLIRESGDIDINVIRGDEPSEGSRDASESSDAGVASRTGRGDDAAWSAAWWMRIGAALLLVAAVSLTGHFVFRSLELANVAMIFLAAVVVSAMWLGRAPAVVAAVAGVAAFDFFFVPPNLTFAVSDVQYLLTFGVMLTVGLLIAHLTTHLRALADASRERERRTAAMYALSRELAAAEDLQQAAIVSARHLHDTLMCDAVICVPDEAVASKLNVVSASGPAAWFDERERGIARWALDHAQPSGLGTLKLPSAAGRHLPIAGSRGRIGVISLRPRKDSSGRTSDASLLLDPAGLFLVETMTNQIASAFERVTFIERHHAARLEAERERLRSALLSSVSHDLRTPLATITGAASTLEQAASTLDPVSRADLLRSIVDESSHLSDIISNLVFATRLEAGGVTLQREWTTIEEIVGAGLSRHREALSARRFSVHVAPDLPLVRVDNAMLPQVVHNLIENALRYTDASVPLFVRAYASGGGESLVVKVVDEGPGLAEHEASHVFQRFYRGRAARDRSAGGPAAQSGMGLGLTICEGIIRAHGGRIWAEPNAPRGVAFIFSLPVEHPQPILPEELRDAAASDDANGVVGS